MSSRGTPPSRRTGARKGDDLGDETGGTGDDATATREPTPDDSPLTVDALVSLVHGRFSSARRAQIPVEMVREVVESLDLDETPISAVAPRFLLTRLRFTGEKRLNDGTATAIDYDQRFAPGVNVVLIADNSVGKSSIFKTIKFALTGDDSDYDSDVRSWIRDIWLQFSLEDAPFTIHLSRRPDAPDGQGVLPVGATGVDSHGLSGYIATGHTGAATDRVAAPSVILKVLRGAGAAQAELHQFFLDAFGLTTLSWTQDVGDGAAERKTSWRTFFQALVIPDSSEDYLLLDEAHNIGNQGGLILSVFLGLRLAEPLNQLLVDSKMAQSATKLTSEERAQAEADLAALQQERDGLARQVQGIDDAQRARRTAVIDNADARRHRELIMRQAALDVDYLQLRGRLTEQSTLVTRLFARARSLREAITLRRHFTGLEVALCPNCDLDVDAEAVERERHDHVCRLCSKLAAPATGDDIAGLEAEAEDLERQAEDGVILRDDLSGQVRQMGRERSELEAEVQLAAAVAESGPAFAFLTPEEDARRTELLQSMGELRGRIGMATAVVERSRGGAHSEQLRALVREKVRLVLQEHARRLNGAALTRLAALVGETSARIGADSITDVTVSPLGALALRKHGTKVSFGSIQNPGERLRVKLAFFLAMMQQGRLKGPGRHPGFLMIDQPGSDEMVIEDFVTLARVLRDVDRDLAASVQILCFTARREFADATSVGKVYGPTVGKFAF